MTDFSSMKFVKFISMVLIKLFFYDDDDDDEILVGMEGNTIQINVIGR
jgi:hypothetical protein